MTRLCFQRRNACLVAALVFGLSMVGGAARAQAPVFNELSREAAIQEVERSIRIVETQIDETSQSVTKLANRTETHRRTLDEMINQLATLQPPEKDEPEVPKKPGLMQVEGRVPMTHLVENKKNILLILEGGRATNVDFDPINAASQSLRATILSEARAGTKTRWEGVQTVTGGHWDFKYESRVEGDYLITRSHALVRKAGHDGETSEQFDGDSEVRRLLTAADAHGTTVQLAVYSDSFDLFRKIRSMAMKRGFEIGFEPVAPGEPIYIGAGGVSVQ